MVIFGYSTALSRVLIITAPLTREEEDTEKCKGSSFSGYVLKNPLQIVEMFIVSSSFAAFPPSLLPPGSECEGQAHAIYVTTLSYYIPLVLLEHIACVDALTSSVWNSSWLFLGWSNFMAGVKLLLWYHNPVDRGLSTAGVVSMIVVG
jgi:hypothetical protein